MNKYEIVHKLNRVKLVIGNGFDLHCRLKSSYNDFFIYNKEKNNCIYEWIEKFKNKAVDYCGYPSNYEWFWVDIINFDKINVWDIYFNIGSKNFEYWKDVELELFNSLNYTDKKNNNILWKYVLRIINKNASNSCDDYTYVLAGYIMKKTGHKILTDSYFYQFLLDELNKFEANFGKYIKEQLPKVNPFAILTNREYINMSKYTIDDLCTKQNIVSINSFNYGLISDEELISKFRNINGNVDNPIFGVDSCLCEPDDPRYIFTKTCRRMTHDLYTDEINQEEDFENVIIYGHSFSQNDFSYFFPLLDKIEITNMIKKGKIVFAYSIYDKNKKDEILVNQRKGITNLFYEYAKYKGINDSFRLLDSISTLDRIILYEINN